MLSRLLLSSIFAGSLAVLASAQQQCNGYSEFCNKPYNELTYVLTHNSYAYTANAAANQQCSITSQLADGVRGLKLSAVKANSSDSTIYLCHTSCSILNAGPATDTLSSITNWVKNNPNEVLTIMWNNPYGDFYASDFANAYQQSGLADYSYAQPQGNLSWPTLQELIASGKRVINFLDVNADQSTVPWIMSEFDYVFETPYDNSKESDFSCVIDRPQNPSNNPSQMMYVMNHFLYGNITIGKTTIQIPQQGSANVTNSDSSLLVQADECKQTFGRQPNFLEVDFYNKGDTLQIAAALNNVTYNNSTVLQCDQQSTSTGGSNTNSGATSLSSLSFTTAIATSIFWFFLWQLLF